MLAPAEVQETLDDVTQPGLPVIQEDHMKGRADEHHGQEPDAVLQGGVGLPQQVHALPDLVVFPHGMAHPKPEGAHLFLRTAHGVVQDHRVGQTAEHACGLEPPAEVPVGHVQKYTGVPKFDFFEIFGKNVKTP